MAALDLPYIFACSDGSDEPGTSACPNMKFHCINTGHTPKDIFSSRVNDKICDCCDGSDEWGTDTDCPNTCLEMGRKAEEEKQRLRELHSSGFQKRQEYSKEGKEKIEESKVSLAEKETQLEDLAKEVEALAAAKETAEEPERAAKEEHRKRWEDEKEEMRQAERQADARFGFDELDTNSDGYVTVDELRIRYELDDDEDGEISEEEALEYLNQQRSVDFETFYADTWEGIADKCHFERPSPPPPSIQPPLAPVEEQEKVNRFDDEEDEDSDDEDYDDEDDEDFQDDDDKMPEYDDATKELISRADEARNAHREADTRKKNLEREIGDLRKYLEINYGVEYEFSPLYNQCYEFTDREYTYKMCAFGKVTQRPKSGGRETNLGNWGKWYGPSNKLYSVMRYEDGEKCWNGPSRSATITLTCGLEDQLLSASEPNRCEYAMEFSTPAVCEQPKHAHTEL